MNHQNKAMSNTINQCDTNVDSCERISYPLISKTQVELNNLVVRFMPYQQFLSGDRVLPFQLKTSNDTFHPYLCLNVKAQAHHCRVILDREMTDSLLKPLLTSEALCFLPESLRELATQTALDPLLDQIEHRTGLCIKLAGSPNLTKDTSYPPEHNKHPFKVYLETQRSGGCLIEFDRQLFAHFESLVTDHSAISKEPATWTNNVPYFLRRVLAETRITSSQLPKLSNGSTVFFDQCYCYPDTNKCKVIVNQHIQYLAHQQNDKLILESSYLPNPEELSMAPEPSTIDDVPVSLTFECAQHSITLAQLQQLHEGVILTTNVDVDQAVKVLANGAVIGECQLVSVAGKLGAKLTRLDTRTSLSVLNDNNNTGDALHNHADGSDESESDHD